MQTVAGYQCTRYHKIPGTACLTGSSECPKNRSNTCPKFTNDRTVGMYFQTATLLQSEQSSQSTLLLQAFTNPCLVRSWVAVAVHSFSRGGVGKMTDPTNALDNQTQNNTVKYSTYGALYIVYSYT